MTTFLRLTTGHTSDGTPDGDRRRETDPSNAGTFRQTLAKTVEPDRRPLAVDLTQIDDLDSAALAVLFAHAENTDIRIAPLPESQLTISGDEHRPDVEDGLLGVDGATPR
ncbi:STAS domain-containing protein [Micromonospora fluostatini]|uniref:STAS domain-containing protein n=1 Tax=Micromonospora sp. JCM 30529 TaxID=3421643 RepID=UPI003D175104